jgi:hypothetical protein
MPTKFPLVTSSLMTSQIGNDMLLVQQAIRDATGLVGTTDTATAIGKIGDVVARIGTTTTANTVLKLISDLAGGLGNSGSTAATSPSSSSSAIGFLKLISTYLQTIAGTTSVCTKASIALPANTSTIVIASGAKTVWGVFNHSSVDVWLEYGNAAVANTGFLLEGKTAILDDIKFTGAIHAIGASATSLDYRVFT